MPSEQALEVDYLENRQQDYQNPYVGFVVKKQRFAPAEKEPCRRRVSFDLAVSIRENYLQLASTTSSFTNAVKELQRKKGDEADIKRFSLDGAHDWKEVQDIVKSAETRYFKKDSVSGKIRAMFRKIGDNGKSIQPFIGLLPDGNYKTLCGGLTLVLTVRILHR